MGAPEIDFSRLNVEERIALMGRIWNSLSDKDVLVSPELAAELDRRLAEHRADPSAGKDWETLREELGRRLQ
ncbi:MAG: addiction module protein [Gemmatimonadetes bacterium]|nr:addiction module protein [Gemmatimonadota bacterium]